MRGEKWTGWPHIDIGIKTRIRRMLGIRNGAGALSAVTYSLAAGVVDGITGGDMPRHPQHVEPLYADGYRIGRGDYDDRLETIHFDVLGGCIAELIDTVGRDSDAGRIAAAAVETMIARIEAADAA